MAAIRFNSNYFSYNGWSYYIEIWDKNFTGSATSIKLSAGGAFIEWTGDDDRFAPILASTCTIGLIVEDILTSTWLNVVRTTYEEQELYLHVYRHGSATGRPLWSGYLLMDLSSDEDVSYPYEFNLKFTDGLGLLKERPFASGNAPYDSSDVYWGPASISYWIKQILNKTGQALTTEGASVNWNWYTAVDWYNTKHTTKAQNFDPFEKTEVKVSMLSDAEANDTYRVKSSYEALSELLRHWCCRVVYWKHTFWVVQIPSYTTTESGTYANPQNIVSREYLYNQNTINADYDALGWTGADNFWTPYQLEIELNAASVGIKKLTGTTYNFLPPLKLVKAQFFMGGEDNFYAGFPLTSTTLTTQETITEAANATSMILETPLQVTHDLTGLTGNAAMTNFQFFIYFTVVADDSTFGGSTTKYLWKDATAAYGYKWDNTEPSTNGDRPRFNSGQLQSTGTITTFEVGGPIGGTNITIPSDPAFTAAGGNTTGNFVFSIKVGHISGTTGSAFTAKNLDNNVTFQSNSTVQISWYNILSDNNITLQSTTSGMGWVTYQYFGTTPTGQIIGNPFKGRLQLVSATGLANVSGQHNLVDLQSSTNSQILDLGERVWGDTPNGLSEGATKVYNNTASAWQYTDFDGEWGVGSIVGTNSFTVLGLIEILQGQKTIIKKANMTLVMPKGDQGGTIPEGLWKNDGTGNQAQYINPVGIIIENPPSAAPSYYVFSNGSFTTGVDEWNYNGFEIKSESVTGATTTTTNMTVAGGSEPNAPVVGAMMIPPPAGVTAIATNNILTSTGATISAGAVTSITILAIGTALLKDGDKIALVNKSTSEILYLEINADQGAADTTLTIVSYTFGEDIPVGSFITHSEFDLITQYQNKTRGTIAGMPVDADELGCIKYTSGDDTYEIDADTIIGVDLAYIKILPRDFLANDDNTTYSVAWKDGSGQTGVIPEDGALEMFAFVQIPYGKTATAVDVWGSNAKALNVYVHDVDSGGGMGTAIGTGTVNSQLDITDTASTATNFLVIKITTTATSNRIYGGKVTLIDTP